MAKRECRPRDRSVPGAMRPLEGGDGESGALDNHKERRLVRGWKQVNPGGDAKNPGER